MPIDPMKIQGPPGGFEADINIHEEVRLPERGGAQENVRAGMDRAADAFMNRGQRLDDVATLKTADALANDAFSRVQNPNASFGDKFIANEEMRMASMLRQEVGNRVSPHERREITQADFEQQVGFGLAESRNPLNKFMGDALGADAAHKFQGIDRQIMCGDKPMSSLWKNFAQILQIDHNHVQGGPLEPRRCHEPQPWSATNQGNGKASIDLGDYTLNLNKANSQWTLTDKKTGAVTNVSGDPHVAGADGNNWTFKNNTTFQLADGTKITCKTSPYGNGQTLSNELDITKGNQSIKVTGLAQNNNNPLTITEGFNGRQLAASNLGDDTIYESGKSWLTPDGEVVNEKVAQQDNL